MRLRATRDQHATRAHRLGLAKSKREGCVTGDHRLAAHQGRGAADRGERRQAAPTCLEHHNDRAGCRRWHCRSGTAMRTSRRAFSTATRIYALLVGLAGWAQTPLTKGSTILMPCWHGTVGTLAKPLARACRRLCCLLLLLAHMSPEIAGLITGRSRPSSFRLSCRSPGSEFEPPAGALFFSSFSPT